MANFVKFSLMLLLANLSNSDMIREQNTNLTFGLFAISHSSRDNFLQCFCKISNDHVSGHIISCSLSFLFANIKQNIKTCDLCIP